jgi:hypothetical protein
MSLKRIYYKHITARAASATLIVKNQWRLYCGAESDIIWILTHSLTLSRWAVRCSRAVVNANLTLDARISVSNHSRSEQRPKLSAAVCSNKALAARNPYTKAKWRKASAHGMSRRSLWGVYMQIDRCLAQNDFDLSRFCHWRALIFQSDQSTFCMPKG